MAEVEEQEEELITRKEEREEKHPDTFHVRFYCARCKSELMWTIEFRDVSSRTVVEKWDCPHYEWVTAWCNPRRFDPEKWECQLEEPWINTIKDRVVFVYSEMSEYYVLLKKVKE